MLAEEVTCHVHASRANPAPPLPGGGGGQVKALGDPVTVLQSAVLPKRHHNSLFIRGY